MIARGNVVEVWANEATGSWSFVVTLPTGMACITGAGKSYEEVNDDLIPTGVRI